MVKGGLGDDWQLGIQLAQDADRQQQFLVLAESFELNRIDPGAHQREKLSGVSGLSLRLAKAAIGIDAYPKRTD